MNKIVIDEELKGFIPAPTKDEFKQLEQNIIKEGCRDALILWGAVLIDGHNRYKICTKHNIKFKTIQMKFDNKDDVLIWIDNNQLGRRNDTKYANCMRGFKIYEILKKKAKQTQGKRTDIYPNWDKGCPINSLKDITNGRGVSKNTFSKAIYISNNATKEQIKQLLNKETSINKIYTILKKQSKNFDESCDYVMESCKQADVEIKRLIRERDNKISKVVELTDEIVNTVIKTDVENWALNTKKDVICEICGCADRTKLINNPKIKQYNTICIKCFGECIAKFMVK